MTARSSEQVQAEYYSRTASAYDGMHVNVGDEHYEALEHIAGFVTSLRIASLLDVGSGTGRALSYLRGQCPELRLMGIEPVAELVELAVSKHAIDSTEIMLGSGDQLPFEDGSFDAVTEVGVLHHVSDPSRIVSEMTRVARRAIFLSDTNRFGYGSPLSRLGKLALCRAGLWPTVDWLRNRGRRYRISDDDGLFYSYSVYDSYRQLAAWADRLILIPTRPASSASLLHPLLTTTHVLLCAVRDETPERHS